MLETITQPESVSQTVDMVSKGGALVLLALLLGYLARAIPKHVGRLQDSFDSTIAKLCEEQKKDRDASESSAQKYREQAEANAQRERDACDRRLVEERAANDRRFDSIKEFHGNVVKILSDQNVQITKLVERLSPKGS